jgi:hypothetical protein
MKYLMSFTPGRTTAPFVGCGRKWNAKKCKQGCCGTYGGVWWNLRLVESVVWEGAVCFVLLCSAGIGLQ